MVESVEMTVNEQETLALVGDEPITAAEIHAQHHCSVGVPTISRELLSLHRKGFLKRQWRGNQRYGCWAYSRS